MECGIRQAETVSIIRISAAAQSTTSGTESLTLADDAGWTFQDTGWTVIVVLLPGGDSVAFAGTAGAQRCQALASDFLRQGANPASIK